MAALDLLNDPGKPLSILSYAVRVDQVIGQKLFRAKSFIEHHGRSRGRIECGKKLFVETNSADDVQPPSDRGHGTTRKQAEGGSGREFFFFKNRRPGRGRPSTGT